LSRFFFASKQGFPRIHPQLSILLQRKEKMPSDQEDAVSTAGDAPDASALAPKQPYRSFK
jgi:hypothetical protein